MKPAPSPSAELARARAAIRAADTAWDAVLRTLAQGGNLADAVAPLQPPPEPEEVQAEERRSALLERRAQTAEEMRANWPAHEPRRRRWWRR